MARWSHKHLAHISNLGRFGMHHMIITPAGCAGRLGSMVTEAQLEDNFLMDTNEACLQKAGQECGKCMGACPVDALNKNGFERRRCSNRLNENNQILNYFSDPPGTIDVCGKCAALMPCSFNDPVMKATPKP